MIEQSPSNGSSRARRGGRITTVDDDQLLDELTPVDDFTDRSPERRSLVKPIVTCVVATALSLGVFAGVMTAASTRATAQDSNTVIVDGNRPDESKAKPLNTALDATQNKTDDQTPAGLSDFGARDTSASRSSVRTELSKAITAAAVEDSSLSQSDQTAKLKAMQATASKDELAKQINADIASAKAKAAQVIKEREEAKRLLAAAAAKKKADAAGTNSDPNAQGVDTSALSNASNGRGALPIARGSYTLSASWHQYGVWAKWHTGQDFAAACGTTIYAAADGVVGSPVGAWWPGNNVVIHHANGGSTLYAHMISTPLVSPGQTVKAGQPIGHVGNTGNSYGCHTHFEYYPAGAIPGDVYSTGDPIAFLHSLGVNP